MTDGKKDELVGLTAQVAAAYFGKNTVQPQELAGIIAEIHSALKRASEGGEVDASPEVRPAVPVKKSVFPDYIVCLEDGKKFKSLKRHLRTHYKLTPDEYRAKWNLAHDYPMVAPNYAAARSQLAKRMGLGTRRDKD
jgi:predicted transcriptional regulator